MYRGPSGGATGGGAGGAAALAYTGADVGWWVAFAAVLLIGGLLLVWAAHRRPRRVGRHR